MDVSILISNPLINVGVVSWILAQAIKTVLDALKHRAFNRQRLAGAGGMPSSHSAVCCSVVLTSYFLYGFQSPVFALAAPCWELQWRSLVKSSGKADSSFFNLSSIKAARTARVPAPDCFSFAVAPPHRQARRSNGQRHIDSQNHQIHALPSFPL